MTRNDNNANVIAFSEKTDVKTALKLIDTMVNTPFAGIDRYKRRINIRIFIYSRSTRSRFTYKDKWRTKAK